MDHLATEAASAPIVQATAETVSPEDRCYPSRHGAILGDALALLAAAGRKDAPMEIPEGCLTCAFRPGTLPNEMAATGKMALDCVLGIDPDRFACHHGMKDGRPQELCAGYIAALLAPWSFTKEVVAAVHRDLGALGGHDDVRAAFDTWYAEVDPAKKLNEYQLARLYASRRRKQSPVPPDFSLADATAVSR